MIEVVQISKNAADYNSIDDFMNKYETSVVRSYDDYKNKGHEWCWCLVGNIVEQHEYGEEHEIKYGTKQFSRGTKVYLAPAQWGDGYENIVVIGLPRNGRNYIEVVTRSKYVENFRMQKVYKPAILKRMCISQWRWWGDADSDRSDIIKYLDCYAPEESEKQRAIFDKFDL